MDQINNLPAIPAETLIPQVNLQHRRSLGDLSNIIIHRDKAIKRKIASPLQANTDEELAQMAIAEHQVNLFFVIVIDLLTLLHRPSSNYMEMMWHQHGFKVL